MNKYLCLLGIMISFILFFLSRTPFFGVLVGVLVSRMYLEYQNKVKKISLEQVFAFLGGISILVISGGDYLPPSIMPILFTVFLGGAFILMFTVWWKKY